VCSSRRQRAGQNQSSLSNIFERHYQIKIISRKKSTAEQLSTFSSENCIFQSEHQQSTFLMTNELGVTCSTVQARWLVSYITWGQTAGSENRIRREHVLRFNREKVRGYWQKECMTRSLPIRVCRKTSS
jgi:hypothetical protein